MGKGGRSGAFENCPPRLSLETCASTPRLSKKTNASPASKRLQLTSLKGQTADFYPLFSGFQWIFPNSTPILMTFSGKTRLFTKPFSKFAPASGTLKLAPLRPASSFLGSCASTPRLRGEAQGGARRSGAFCPSLHTGWEIDNNSTHKVKAHQQLCICAGKLRYSLVRSEEYNSVTIRTSFPSFWIDSRRSFLVLRSESDSPIRKCRIRIGFELPIRGLIFETDWLAEWRRTLQVSMASRLTSSKTSKTDCPTDWLADWLATKRRKLTVRLTDLQTD